MTGAPDIVVHYLNNSRAHRLLWLLEELGLGYEVRSYTRDSRWGAPPELKTVHPLGKSPVVEVDGKVLAESGAIFEYLCDRFGSGDLLPPPGDAARPECIFWLHYSEGSAMPLLVDKLTFTVIPKAVPFFIRPIASLISAGMIRERLDPDLKRHVAFWQDSLAATGWFAGGRFSAADIMMSFPLESGRSRADLDPAPAVTAWLAKIQERPAYQRALVRGGAYELAQSGVDI